jgi:hypothetical protein
MRWIKRVRIIGELRFALAIVRARNFQRARAKRLNYLTLNNESPFNDQTESVRGAAGSIRSPAIARTVRSNMRIKRRDEEEE